MRPKLTYSNVVSTLCLFLLLGGGAAYAAGHLAKNSVGSKQLKNNSVITAKIKNEAVTGAKVKSGTLTGTQINASTLGTVPSAEHANAAQTADSAQSANSLAAPEAWHEVGKPGEPQFQNGCKNSGGGIVPVRFYKDHEGVVHLEGDYEGCSSPGEPGFQLPAGYRPGSPQEFPLAYASEGEVVVIYPTIGNATDGVVRCIAAHCALNGITFRAES